VSNRLHRVDLLQYTDFIGSAPTLGDLPILVELGDLHATDLDLLAGRRNSLKGAVLRTGDQVRESDVVLIRDEMLDCNLKVGKCRVKLRNPVHETAAELGLPTVALGVPSRRAPLLTYPQPQAHFGLPTIAAKERRHVEQE
jgi:hypothetical protein